MDLHGFVRCAGDRSDHANLPGRFLLLQRGQPLGTAHVPAVGHDVSAVASHSFAAARYDHQLLRPDCESSGTPIRRLAPDMFDTLILLSGPAEHSVFATLLRSYNPSLNVLPVFTAADLAAIEAEWLPGARLVSFAGSVKVPAAVVAQLGYGAYNFHPGSPHYPGDAPVQDAIDDGAPDFGCTLHRVTERAETGPRSMCSLFRRAPASVNWKR